jgi:glycosyltransferase involved in cell wall biosynthesis
MDRSRVGIVIPALNESATIVDIVRATGVFGVPIVIDDGSTDATAELALGGGAVVASHVKNQGYDAALNTGFKKAAELGCEIVITVDADGQHNPLLIQNFIDAIDTGSDIVVGIRSSRQRFAEHLFAWYTQLRFGIKDPLCGMKAYRIVIYKSLGHFDSYGSIGAELMIFAATKGYRIGQISFDVQERKGQSRFGQMLSGNYKIIRAMMLSIWRFK